MYLRYNVITFDQIYCIILLYIFIIFLDTNFQYIFNDANNF